VRLALPGRGVWKALSAIVLVLDFERVAGPPRTQLPENLHRKDFKLTGCGIFEDEDDDENEDNLRGASRHLGGFTVMPEPRPTNPQTSRLFSF
jgi:hypothetical protein